MKYNLLFLTLITCSFASAGYHDGDFAKNNHHFYDDQNESSEMGWKGTHDFIWNDSGKVACEHCPYNNKHRIRSGSNQSSNDSSEETPRKVGKRMRNQEDFSQQNELHEVENNTHQKSWINKLRSFFGRKEKFKDQEMNESQNEINNKENAEVKHKSKRKNSRREQYREPITQLADERDTLHHEQNSNIKIASKRRFGDE